METKIKACPEFHSMIPELTFSGLDENHQDTIRRMPALFADTWGRKLRRIDAVEYSIGLTQNICFFRSAPYCSGPGTCKLEELEFEM